MVKILARSIKGRGRDTHKGDFGHVFVLAGSRGLTGAAYLASQAALVSGSGLVTLGIPESLNSVMEVKLTEVMTLPISETREGSFDTKGIPSIKRFAKKVNAIALGPGLSRNIKTAQLAKIIATTIDKPIVLDADGINAFEGKAALLNKSANLVITPHPGELARLIKKDVRAINRNRVDIAKCVARDLGCIVVLKGAKTIVANPKKETYINNTGNPGMATGGTGDVLTGMIASLIGQGLEPFGAAKLAVYVHGKAGDMACKDKGEISLIASDLLNRLPEAFRSL